MSKKIIGDPLIINGRKLSLSKAVRAGDFVYLTGQVPMKNGVVITEGSIEEQTRIVLDEIKNTLKEAGLIRFMGSILTMSLQLDLPWSAIFW